MKASSVFLPAVQRVWGDPHAVSEAGINELFRHDRNFDHDAQVRDAMNVGILAGEMKNATPEEFVAEFERQILSE